MLFEHLQGLWEYKGDRGICQSRKHLAWYCKGFYGAAQLREQLAQINIAMSSHILTDSHLVKMAIKLINNSFNSMIASCLL